MKKQLLLFVMILLPMVAMADAVEIDGIYYNLITKVGIAEVTYGNWTPLFDHDGDGRYSGIINIPESVTYEDVNYSVTSIGAKAFMHCKGLTSVTIPNSVTSIGEEAFQNCKGLTSITIPKSITKIENNGFWLCSSLTSVNISDIAAWCNISFSSETSNPLYEAQRLYLNGEEVTDLTIPNNVTSISNNAFINCKSLSSVTFHGDLKSIGENAFSGCANIPSVIIPNSVTDMGISAFENCIGLTSVKIGNGINYLSQYDFAGCTSIKHLIIDCKEISEFCFINFTSVEDITLGDRVEKIGSKAFSGCIGITTVNFGANIKTVEEDAFKGIPNNSKINISDIKGWCQIDFSNSTANPLFYTKKIFLNDEEIKNLIIPEGISSIGKNAFIRCEGLTSITLPQSVKTIGEDAFKECEGLLTIHISDLRMWFSYKFNITSNPLYYARHLYLNGEEIKELIVPDDITSINDYLFYKCLSITSLTIGTNVASIGECAFARCENLNSVTLSEGLKSIGRSTFSGCKDLSNIDLPNSLYSLGMSAFEGCSNLSSIIIPNKITKIEAATFYKCIELVSVAMGNGVRDIRYEAFSNCSRLASVSIGSGITKIEHNAFENCPELNNFYCYAENVPTTGKDVFKGSYIEYATLYVPASSISDYQQAEPWKNFKEVTIAPVPKYTLTYVVDGEIYKSFLIEEGYAITPEPAPTKDGYTFSGWSEIPETMPAHDVTVTGTFSINSYKLTYMVDGVEHKSYDIEYGTTITPEAEPTKEGYTFSGWSEIPETMPAHDVTITGTFSIDKYKLTYMVDGVEYRSYEIEYGATITPEPAPTKDGYTFSGWSEIPETMPAHDVTVSGTFEKLYKLTYLVDNEVYKSYDLISGEVITPEPAPTKEGYTFSGWSEIPETMPAHDVTITGTFTVNTYKLTYKVDGLEYRSYDIEYGASITPEAAPTKDGYTFSGWSEIPEKMPAHDVTVTGSFSINSYKLTYVVDGEVYKTYDIEYDATITPEAEPTKEGYTFSGWSEIPATMPAHDVTITGTFNINKYKLTYVVDGEVYKTYDIEYGATITPETEPTKEGYNFSGWSEIPETMPAHDVTVTGSFTKGQYKLNYMVDGQTYKTISYDYGDAITPEPAPVREGYTFSGWSEIPATMPAHDVTVSGTFSINSYKLTYMIDDKVYKETMYEYGATIVAEPQPEGNYETFEWVGLPQTMPAHDVVVNASYTITGIIEMLTSQQQNIRIYSPNGKMLNKPQKGLNIIQYRDGTTRKMVVK